MSRERTSQTVKLGKSWKDTFDLMILQPKIMFPFLILAVIDLIGMIALFVFEQPPLNKFLAPIVFRFLHYGPQSLHYPFNLLLLSSLFQYLQMFTSIIIGTLMSGLTINGVQQYYQTGEISYKVAFKNAVFKYVNLFIITLAVFFLIAFFYGVEKVILIKLLSKGPSFLGIHDKDWTMIGLIFAVIGISGIIQSLLVYAQPSIMLDNKNFVVAIFRSLYYAFTNCFGTLLLVVIPLLFFLPITLVKNNFMPLMKISAPEIVFVVLVLGTLITMAINIVITISSTRMYAAIRDEKESAE